MSSLSLWSFNTPLMNKIDAATSETLIDEDWTLNMDICDSMKTEENGEKNAAKELKKRLTSKNPRVVMLSLTVLETCMKNCGPDFIKEICKVDFLRVLEEMVESKDSAPQIKTRILDLISQWSSAFESNPEFHLFQNSRRNLSAQGFQLPNHVSDHNHTFSSTPLNPVRNQSPPSASLSEPFQRISLNAAQVQKLKTELAVVTSNVAIFMDALTQDTFQREIIEPIHATCKEMHRRILFLIEEIEHEEIMELLLQSNDILTTAFRKFDEKNKLFPPHPFSSSPSSNVAPTTTTPCTTNLTSAKPKLTGYDVKTTDKEKNPASNSILIKIDDDRNPASASAQTTFSTSPSSSNHISAASFPSSSSSPQKLQSRQISELENDLAEIDLSVGSKNPASLTHVSQDDDFESFLASRGLQSNSSPVSNPKQPHSQQQQPLLKDSPLKSHPIQDGQKGHQEGDGN